MRRIFSPKSIRVGDYYLARKLDNKREVEWFFIINGINYDEQYFEHIGYCIKESGGEFKAGDLNSNREVEFSFVSKKNDYWGFYKLNKKEIKEYKQIIMLGAL